MKKLAAMVSIAVALCNAALCQNNVGINVTQPTEALTIDRGLLLDNNNQNTGISLMNGLRFGNAANNSQLTGIASNRSGGGASLYGLDFYTSGTRSVQIAYNGFVGINTTPLNYFLEVGGTIKGNTIRSGSSIFAEGGNVQASGDVIAANNVKATAGNITADVGNIVATAGELKASGRGVVMSNNATRQRIYVGTAGFTITNLGVGNSVTGILSMPAGTFNAAPTAYVGNVVTQDGDYFKATLVCESVTTTSITIRIVNLSSAPISFNGASWKILAIGPF